MGTTSSDTGRGHADLAAPVARAGLPEPASPAPAERPASPEAAQSAAACPRTRFRHGIGHRLGPGRRPRPRRRRYGGLRASAQVRPHHP
ncbi:hypothetical protein ACFQVA_28005 [Actinomadura keratinilytica]